MPRPSPCAGRMPCPSSSPPSTRRTTSGAWPWARPWAPGSTEVTRHEPDGRRRGAHGSGRGGPGAAVGGGVVRLNIPPLTEERRRDLVKLVHRRMEDARVEIRNHRREAADTIKARERDGEIGADEGRRELDHLQKVTDRWIDEVERIGKAKEQEGLGVS